jgi:hypothetical protein
MIRVLPKNLSNFALFLLRKTLSDRKSLEISIGVEFQYIEDFYIVRDRVSIHYDSKKFQ